MAVERENNVIFTGGFSKTRHWLIISAYAAGWENSDQSILYFYRDGEWSHLEVDMTIEAICGILPPGVGTYVLGQSGRVGFVTSGISFEQIPDAGIGQGGYGFVTNMRQIGDRLYVCGMGGQIYRREPRGWVHLDQGILKKGDRFGKPQLYAIDGSSERDVWTVGEEGLAWHFDGHTWMRSTPPTSVDLNWVRALAPDEVYVCGNNGSFLRWDGSEWRDFSLPPDAGDLWCVESYKKKVYLAADDGIWEFDGNKSKRMQADFGLDEGHRLHANDGVLWSFSEAKICSFNGKKWSWLRHPDNDE